MARSPAASSAVERSGSGQRRQGQMVNVWLTTRSIATRSICRNRDLSSVMIVAHEPGCAFKAVSIVISKPLNFMGFGTFGRTLNRTNSMPPHSGLSACWSSNALLWKSPKPSFEKWCFAHSTSLCRIGLSDLDSVCAVHPNSQGFASLTALGAGQAACDLPRKTRRPPGALTNAAYALLHQRQAADTIRAHPETRALAISPRAGAKSQRGHPRADPSTERRVCDQGARNSALRRPLAASQDRRSCRRCSSLSNAASTCRPSSSPELVKTSTCSARSDQTAWAGVERLPPFLVR